MNPAMTQRRIGWPWAFGLPKVIGSCAIFLMDRKPAAAGHTRFFAILLHTGTLIDILFTGLNNAVAYQKLQTSGI